MPSLTSSPPLLTLPVDKSSLFNRLFGPGSAQHEVFTLKFLGVPCLPLAGITVAVSYMFVMGRSTADNSLPARVDSGVNSLSAAPCVTVGRIKFDIPGLIQNAKGDV